MKIFSTVTIRQIDKNNDNSDKESIIMNKLTPIAARYSQPTGCESSQSNTQQVTAEVQQSESEKPTPYLMPSLWKVSCAARFIRRILGLKMITTNGMT